MKKLYTAFIVLVLAVLSVNPLLAQEIDTAQARSLLSKNAPALNLSSDDVQNSIILNSYVDKLSKAKLVYVQQAFNGIPVYNVVQVFAFRNDVPVSQSGERIYRIQDQISDQKTAPAISGREAVAIAAKSLEVPIESLRTAPLIISKATADQRKLVFEQNAISQEPVTAELMWVPDQKRKIHLGWQVSMLPQKSSDHWMIRVDARNGSIIGKDNLTVYCNWELPQEQLFTSALQNLKPKLFQNNKSTTFLNGAQYRVVPFPAESPVHPGGTPAIVSNPWQLAGTGNNATTLSWHNDGATEYNYTRGNNVWARDDVAGDNEGTLGSPAFSSTPLPNLLFDFPQDINAAPGTTNNKNLAITNLFYWNNIMHDLTYQYGFDEVSGNFQNNNQGRGGAQGDYVIADAQDGSGRNNANFGTPADGVRPRMQMYLWNDNRKVWLDIPGLFNDFISSLEGQMSTANLLKNVGPVSGDLVLYNDNLTGTVTHLACDTPVNGSALSGKIALIDRGTCDFAVKVKNAQDAGAIAVLVINSNPDELIIMTGDDNTITIPALMITKGDGDALRTVMTSNTVHVTLKTSFDVDGDLDNGIIAHEYGHGVSNRLTGGPSMATCLQNNEQMGEGWSDFFALMVTTDWTTASVTDGNKSRAIANYVTSQDPVSGAGIRTYPYSTDMSTNPWTYGQLSTIKESEEHLVGEIWAATLWDMNWNMIQMDGINNNIFNANGVGGNSDAMKLVMLGMKLQPCSPGFIDGRDAILKADEILFNGKYRCAIWSAFARRGMGVNAKQGSAYNTYDQVQNFDAPSGASITKKVDLATVPQNGILTYTFTVKAECQPVTNFKVVDTLAGNVTYVSGGTYNAGSRTVTFNIPNLTSLQSTTFTLKVKVNEGTYFADANLFMEIVPTNSLPSTFIATTNKPGSNWFISGVYHSASYSMRSAPTDTATEQVLTVVSPVQIDGHIQLSFWQRLSTQPGKDGGVVELSLDGTTWFDAGPYMVTNGYNTTIHTNSSLDGKKAFSGSSSTFNQTMINLSAFRNQSVYYRFRYVTDTTGNSLGWYIDDITITKKAAVYNIAKVFDNGNSFKALSDTITSITATILPVTWSDFSVQKNGEVALLKWSTAQESKTDKFFVERSTDGVHFNTIASLPAAGNSTSLSQYSYNDESPNRGINFYRIRLSDLDGRVSYSETKALQFDDLLSQWVQLSPNPSRSDVDLFIAGNRTLLKVKVVDATGRVIRNYEMKSDRLTIPVTHLAQGVYYVKVQGKNMNVIKKFVKE